MGAATDLSIFCSASMPSIDTGTSGGAIDLLRRPVFTQMGAPGTLTAVSSTAGDTTQTCTIRARNAAGTVVSQTVTLTGVTPVAFNTLGTVSAVLSVELSATCAGVVTISSSAPQTIGTIPIGERGFMCVHREATVGLVSPATYYYKVFVKNTHATQTLSSANIIETTDALAKVDFALAATKGDSGSVANRVTSPGLTFDSLSKSPPGGTLAAGETIGVWLRFTHPAGEASLEQTLIQSVSGSYP